MTNTEITWTKIAIAELESYLIDPTADRDEQAYAALALREERAKLGALEAAAGGAAR